MVGCQAPKICGQAFQGQGRSVLWDVRLLGPESQQEEAFKLLRIRQHIIDVYGFGQDNNTPILRYVMLSINSERITINLVLALSSCLDTLSPLATNFLSCLRHGMTMDARLTSLVRGETFRSLSDAPTIRYCNPTIATPS